MTALNPMKIYSMFFCTCRWDVHTKQKKAGAVMTKVPIYKALKYIVALSSAGNSSLSWVSLWNMFTPGRLQPFHCFEL